MLFTIVHLIIFILLDEVEHADAIAHFEDLASVPANWRVNASSPSTWRTDDKASTWRGDSAAEIRHVDGAELDEATADVPPIAAGVMKVRIVTRLSFLRLCGHACGGAGAGVCGHVSQLCAVGA